MCLIAWNWQPAASTRLLLLSNRDEFYARPASPLHWWGGEHVLAGKDLQAGGTWLGISRSGRLAALTNYRDPASNKADAPSRGELVADFLQSDQQAIDYLTQLADHSHRYNPFNLLVCDGQQLLGLEGRHSKIVPMQAGIGAVSNADFHTPWPKLRALKQGLQQQLACDANDTEAMLSMLKNNAVAIDAELPHTGIPLALERTLSSAFITSPAYGTRACSVVRLSETAAEFTEVRYGESGYLGRQQTFAGPFNAAL
jgi:uncharacterized protein with NRDE domain